MNDKQAPPFTQADESDLRAANRGADDLYNLAKVYEQNGQHDLAKECRDKADAIYDVTDKAFAHIADTLSPSDNEKKQRFQKPQERNSHTTYADQKKFKGLT